MPGGAGVDSNPEGTPLSACLDADMLKAVTKQFKAPGMPPKGVAALTRVSLLGKEAPQATPAEEPEAPRAAGGKKARRRRMGRKAGRKMAKKGGKAGARRREEGEGEGWRGEA